jgi:hypothetical protein
MADDEVERSTDRSVARRARLLWSLVAVAVVGAGVAAWLTRSPASAPSSRVPAQRSAVAAFSIHAPPDDVPLMWFALPADQVPTAMRLRAVDWNGREVGDEDSHCLAPCSYDASPDGQRVLVREQPAEAQSSAPAGVFDSAGQLVGTIVDPAAWWADDGRHLCTSHSVATPAAAGVVELDLLDPSTSSRTLVAQLAPPSHALSQFAAWEINTCSTLADRVVATMMDSQGLHAVRVFEPSTGRLLYTSDQSMDPDCVCAIDDLVVSHDGAVAVENVVSGGVDAVDLGTGVAIPWQSTPSPLRRVSGLSWNGGRVLTMVASDTNGLVDVRSGRVTWRGAPHTTVSIIAVRPGTDDIALLVSPFRSLGEVVVVRADGSELHLPPAISGQ